MTGSIAREHSDRGAPSTGLRRAEAASAAQAGSGQAPSASSGRAAFRARFAVLQTVGLAGLLALWAGGWLDPWSFDGLGTRGPGPAADRTWMTHGIALVFGCGVVAVGLRSWRWANWIARALVMLGLIGTVLGFIVALSGVDPESARDAANVTPMVARLIDGMGTALMTTLVGSVGNLWLRLNVFVLEGDRDA